MKTEYFESAEVSDVGRKRKNNEDACLRIPEKGIYCVADGMGGQAGGDLASETIVTTLQQVFAKAGPEEEGTLSKRITLFRNGINQASKWIKNFSDEKVIGQMGSTVVALVLDPRNPARAVALHAGDSRLYRYRAGELNQLTADHSALAALAAKLGRDPASLPAKYQNELLRCVGMTESVELEKTPVDVRSGDLFLICSDGLTKMVSDKAVAKILKHGAQDPAGALAQTLINAANEEGGRDNVSVVLVRVGDISGAPAAADAEEEEARTLDVSATPPTSENQTPPGHSGDSHAMPDTVDQFQGETPRTDDANLERTSTPTPREAVTPEVPVAKAEEKAARKGGLGRGRTLGIAGAAVVVAAAGFWIWRAAGSREKPLHVANEGPAPAVAEAPATSKPETPAPATTAAAQPGPAVAAAVQPQPAAAKEPKPALVAKAGPAATGKETPVAGPVALNQPALGNNEKAQADLAAAEAEKARQQELARIQEAFREALANAQLAFGNRDYKNAAEWADKALLKAPGDPSAMRLRLDALRLAAVEESNRKFDTALEEARESMAQGRYALAAAKAGEALALRPNDAAATQLVSQARQSADLEAARASFDRGDYAAVIKLCGANAGIQAFADLEKGGRIEQAALSEARKHFDSGEYSFTVQLKRQAYGRKPPFIDLLNQAANEWKMLGDLETLCQAGNWGVALGKLRDPASAAWAGKAPFRALAARAARQEDFARLNSTLQEMLVWFNIKSADDSYIQVPEARQARPIEGPLSQAKRDEYIKTVDQLESGFDQGGWPDEDDRGKSIKKLRDAIAHHE